MATCNGQEEHVYVSAFILLFYRAMMSDCFSIVRASIPDQKVADSNSGEASMRSSLDSTSKRDILVWLSQSAVDNCRLLKIKYRLKKVSSIFFLKK